MNLDLEKGKEALKLSLEKKGITTIPSADLAFVLDVSGSFDHQHRSGTTQRLLKRLVPWGMLFDPDQKLDVFTFSDGSGNAYHVGDITPDNCEDYIQNEIVDNVPGYSGGTDYGYVLEEVLQNFGWMPKTGLLNRMFSKPVEKRRSIILFVTDGANSDRNYARKVLEESSKRNDQVYFLFIGIGGPFDFLQKVADDFPNTGLTVIPNMRDFVNKTDEQINEELIGEELVTWLKQ